jgi:signal transduction histidine kinase
VSRRVVLPRQASPGGGGDQPGDHAWVIDAAPLEGDVEEAGGTRVVIRNVTSEHQAEQVRKDFVANASHELRTPLAIINGYLENLIDDGLHDDPALTRRFLKVMRKHSTRISRIIEDMLVISRLESGEAAALKIKPFPLRACVDDVLERLEPVITEQSAEVKIRMADPGLRIAGDRFYWTQVMFNLIENALKQNPRPGLKIRIGAAKEEDGSVRIWVADNGIGIPGSDLPFIFRRFYRVEKHHSQDQVKGTGLGLSIVKRAVEAHDGEIDVASTPGQETRFTIRLPAGTAVEAGSTPGHAAETAAAGG